MNRYRLMAIAAVLLITTRNCCLDLRYFGWPLAIPVPWLALTAVLLTLATVTWAAVRELLRWPHLCRMSS